MTNFLDSIHDINNDNLSTDASDQSDAETSAYATLDQIFTNNEQIDLTDDGIFINGEFNELATEKFILEYQAELKRINKKNKME